MLLTCDVQMYLSEKPWKFSVFNENYPLLLGKLMVSLKSWRDARRNYYARCSVVRFFTDRYLAAGDKLLKGGNFP